MASYIKKINIILENTEFFTVPAKKILMFEISGVKEEYARIALNTICKTKTADKIAILIDESADYIGSLCRGSMIKRIENYKDITAIELVYEDDTAETIYTDWDMKSDYTNSYQETIIDKALFITVGKNIHIKDYFKEFFEDETALKFYQEMISEDISDEDEEEN